MLRFFNRERFGRPQGLAACLLLVFLAQCLWLVEKGVHRGTVELAEIYRLQRGTAYWKHQEVVETGSGLPPQPNSPPSRELAQPGVENSEYDANHSPLWYLTASAPLVLSPAVLQPENVRELHRLAAFPYLVFGVLLGASLWYVSRRLFGNAGGYVALALYCFSPGVLRATALWSAEPEVGAAWGVFGTIFTAIAVAHTLYAPREVVLWNWRRILLLGLSLASAVGSQFSLIVVLPLTLAFMLYVVPGRRTAAAVIRAAAVGIGTLILFASYFFHAGAFWQGMRHASFLGISGSALLTPLSYKRVVAQLGQSSPALVLALPFALAIWAGWRRARYFGNTAPLLMAVLLLLFAVGTPHYPGLGFQLVAVPFLFVFVSGIAADLLESGHKNLVTACVWGLLVANAGWNLWELARAGS